MVCWRPSRFVSLECRQAPRLLPIVPAISYVGHNLIKAAEADVAASRERARTALGGWFPNMNLSGFYGHEYQVQPDTDNTSLATREFDVSVTQLLWDFGATNSTIRTAGLVIVQAEAGLNAARQDIQEITARIQNNRTTLGFLEEQISISEELLKDDLTNRYNHLSLLQDASRLNGRAAEDAAALARARSTLKEAQVQLAGIQRRFNEEARTALEDARRQFEERTQRLLKFEDSVRRTVLRSPVDGVVKTLNVATLGGVLRPGLTVAEIVPGQDRLVIEARLPTQDIGYVRAGQKTIVKLASSDAVRFDGLIGVVTNVSPDTLVTSEGVPFYKVRIETDADHFGGDLRYDLFPGMQVVASIHTGRRTILRYLLDPFRASMDGALRER